MPIQFELLVDGSRVGKYNEDIEVAKSMALEHIEARRHCLIIANRGIAGNIGYRWDIDIKDWVETDL